MKVKCDNTFCGKEFNKKPADIKRTKHNFCSRSCANVVLNSQKPKRKPEGNCGGCNCVISKTRKYCEDCRRKNSLELDEMTLDEAIYHKHHRSSAFALVRSRARRKVKSIGLTSCLVCGYNKHIEVAHKKPISTFSLDTKLKIINDKNNLLSLCPNHHWEYDNKLLEMPL